MTNNYQRDGLMAINGNGEDAPNYFPNSFDDIEVDKSYREPAMQLESSVADWFDRNGANDNDHYTQPGNLFRKVMTDSEKKNTIANIVGAMSGIAGPKKADIINRQLCHFFRADIQLGMAIAQGLGVAITDETMAHSK
jgi:catalase